MEFDYYNSLYKRDLGIGVDYPDKERLLLYMDKKTEKQILQKEVGLFCKNHREQVLEMTLQELATDSGINYKTLYSFESGLSSNLHIFYIYYNRSHKQLEFISDLFMMLEKV